MAGDEFHTEVADQGPRANGRTMARFDARWQAVRSQGQPDGLALDTGQRQDAPACGTKVSSRLLCLSRRRKILNKSAMTFLHLRKGLRSMAAVGALTLITISVPWVSAQPAQPRPAPRKPDVIFVPTPQPVVE